MKQVTTTFVIFLQVTNLYCTPTNWMSQIQNAYQWPQLQQPFVQLQQELQPTVQMPQTIMATQLHQPSMQLGHGPQMLQVLPVQHELLDAEQLALQQQMMALQQWQALQKLSAIHSPLPMSVPPPMLIIIPNPHVLIKGEQLTKTTQKKHHETDTNEDSDSVIIENDGSDNEVEEIAPKAILLIPQPRFSLGGIISNIPWLPLEINVPDTIAWGYNGISDWISGIISIIGQTLPMRRPQTIRSVVKPTDEMTLPSSKVKLFLKHLQKKQEPMMPISVVPLGGTSPPFQIID